MTLPMVLCANNVDTPIGLQEKFPGRVGTLLTPGHWKDPADLPYALDNGRYSVWSSGKTWSEEKFFALLDAANKHERRPLWVAVPDVLCDAKATFADWYKWSPIIREKYNFTLALVVQQGMSVDQVKQLNPQPDVIFLGSPKEWMWKTAESWCKNFTHVHVGGVSTKKGLWSVQRLGAESSDSNVWRPVGRHLQVLTDYLTISGEGKKPAHHLVGFDSKHSEDMPKMMKLKRQKITDQYALYCGDSCQVMPELPAESVGLSIFSPPFCDLYSYSDSTEDIGNCRSYTEFFEHFAFLVEQLHRVTMEGRCCVVHCMDLPTFKRSGEEIGQRDFPGDIIKAFEAKDWIYHARVCIWKDPLIAATRTKAIGLAHKQIVKDSSLCRTGIADYLVVFRKKGINPVPIKHPKGLTTYQGSRPIPRVLDVHQRNGEFNPYNPAKDKRSHWIWQQYASPVWFDIRQTKVLPYREARDHDDERHICPLQLDVIERCLELWSSKGDVVLDPFAGVGSVPFVAVRRGRKGVGIELKESYYRQAVRNVQHAMKKSKGLKHD